MEQFDSRSQITFSNTCQSFCILNFHDTHIKPTLTFFNYILQYYAL